MSEEDLDEEFMQELKMSFCVEARDNLENCESHVLSFENSNSSDDLDAIKRELHCLKGSSNAAGLSLFSKIVHAAENYCASGPEASDLANEILKTLDHLKDYLGSVEAGNESDADVMIQEKCGHLLNA